ncbi:MAG: hypothetical protein ABSC47_01225 [Terracidiphilus sp.]|jgi:hypothetical protein
MHFNFAFNVIQVLWTLKFAALLVLLVVLLGRDRMRLFPWFSSSIVLVALDTLGKRLLHGRMPQITLAWIFLTLADLAVIISVLVLVELARRAFAGMRRRTWILGTLVLLAVAAVAPAVWGPWPAWKTLTANSSQAVLELMQLAQQKGNLLVDVLTVELGLLIVLFGRRFKAGWRSHAQQIVIGLSTVAIAQMALQGVLQMIALTAVYHSREEYERILSLAGKVFNANSVVYLAVLLWWIVFLWIDEPGAAQAEIPASQAQEEAAGTMGEKEEEDDL